MSQCVLCKNYYHPDFMLMVDEDVYTCVWCYSERNVINIEDDNTGKQRKVTKEEASRAYLEYLRQLKDHPNIKKILNGE